MTPAEAAELLGYCAAYDRRTLSEIDARAWAAALPDIPFTDARQAVVEHYATETAWLMPAHIRQRVKAMRKARLDRDALPPPPPDATDDPVRYRGDLKARIAQIANGKTVARALTPAAPDPDTYERGADRARAALRGDTHA